MATGTRVWWPCLAGVLCTAMITVAGCRGEAPPATPASGEQPATNSTAETQNADRASGDGANGATEQQAEANTTAVTPAAQEAPAVAAAPEDTPPAPPAPSPTADKPIYAVTPAGDEDEEGAPERVGITLTPAMLSEITEGMAVDAVRGIVGSSGHVVAQADVDSAIMRWTDENGNVFVAKFEDGHLKRKYILSPDGAALDEAGNGRTLERADYEAISPGMTVEEVTQALGLPPRQITSDHAQVIIFSWRDAAGSSFVARFEDGKLIQKSGFFVAPLEEKEDATAEAEPGEGEGEPEGEPPPPRDNRRLIRESIPRQPPVQEPAPAPQPQVTSVAPPSRVRVVGGRREPEPDVPENQRGSYQPRAKLPEFTWGLRRGAYEMRIENTTDTRVQAGLRAGAYGKDITIPANSTRTIGVDRASYQLYYIFDDAPYTLHSGANIDLQGDFLADVRITLFNQSFDVAPIDYGAEFWRNSNDREQCEPY